MCSVQEDDGETQPLPREEKLSSTDQKCMKCDMKAVTIARTKDPFCRSCFHDYFTHRFRAMFGKSKLVREGERVLLALSGGPSSRVLLALSEEGRSERVRKKLRFVPSIVVIDEGAVLGQEWGERCQHLARVLSIGVQSGFPVYFTQLEQIFGSCEARRLEWQPSVTPPVEEEAVSKLQLHKDNPPDTPPDRHGDPLLTPEVSGGEETASETQIEGREETPLWPQQPRNDPLCCEKRKSSPEHQEDTPLPQCESKTATDSSRGEVLCCEKRSSPEHQEDTPLPQCESKTATDSSKGEVLCCEKRSSPEHQEDTPLPQCESKTATDSSRGEVLCCEKRSSPEHQEDTPLPQCESKTATDSSRGEVPLQVLESRRDPSLELQLKKLFDSTKSLTAKENLLLSLRYQLLLEIARRNGFTKVLVGDNATRLAVRLLGNIAQGRGGTLPFDTRFADDRAQDVIFVRPMREFPAQELAAYVTLHSLQTVATPSFSTLLEGNFPQQDKIQNISLGLRLAFTLAIVLAQTPQKTSIEQLTESFITGLQTNFPSTVNTIFRTGDKLSVSDDLRTSKPCTLCQAPCSHTADKMVFTHLNIPDELSGGPASHLWDSLCYGCQLTVKDMGYEVDCLPHIVHSKVERTAGPERAKMRTEIDEFLLDPS